MDMPDRETLSTLGRRVGWPSISIYLPTHRAGQEKEQDPLRLRNLLAQAAEQLRSKEMRQAEIDGLLRDAYALLDDQTFWRDTSEGLAVFIAPEQMNVFKLDTELPEVAVVNERFAIRHLLASIHTEEHFWLLALSKNQVTLYEGDHLGLTEVPLRDTPTNIKEAMRFEDADHAFRFRTETGAMTEGAGGQGSVFYGMGGLPDVEKDQVLRYVHAVERGVREAVRDSQAPLLVAGVEYVVSAYRAQNTYQYLATETIYGNADEIPASRLHAQALEMLRPHFESKRDADLSQLESRAGSSLVSDDLHEIVPAAHDGRVGVLFLSEAERPWGTYDPASRRVRIRAEREPGDLDLADLAAAETILHGGTVHVLPPAETLSEVAGVEPPAAILRY